MSDINTILAAMEAMKAELAKMQAENAALKAKKNTLSMKVSEKGAMSLYGMGRFPVSLYASQWRQLLANIEMITKFVDANESAADAKAAAFKESEADKPTV